MQRRRNRRRILILIAALLLGSIDDSSPLLFGVKQDPFSRLSGVSDCVFCGEKCAWTFIKNQRRRRRHIRVLNGRSGEEEGGSSVQSKVEVSAAANEFKHVTSIEASGCLALKVSTTAISLIS